MLNFQNLKYNFQLAYASFYNKKKKLMFADVTNL